MNRKQKKLKMIAVILCAAVIAGLLLLMNHLEHQEVEDVEGVSRQEDHNPEHGTESILIMGLDKYQAPEANEGYFNDQQADFLLLLVLDHQQHTCQMLHLNRDTMTEIQRLGIGGGVADTFIGQLALAHTFGSGGSDSCINTKYAVSRFLGGVPIDHYASVTMEAVGILNDLAGGVTVTVMDDFTDIDPEMIQGTEVTLKGEQALLYIRARSELEDSSNLHRMERQQQYLGALFDQLQKKNREDPDFLEKALQQISPYLQSDYSVYQLNKLGEQLGELQREPILTIPGKAVKGAGYMEFYPDMTAVEKVVSELFADSAS